MARANMLKLKARGIMFKLDDAGTGYGGFSYIQELPFDIIKIDRLFVSNIGVQGATRQVVDEIIAFSERLGLKMIAEGVENEKQSQSLLDKGVSEQQGFLFSKPLPLAQLMPWLTKKALD